MADAALVEARLPLIDGDKALAQVTHEVCAPLERRAIDVSLEVPAGVVGPLRVEASLVFQSFPSELLAELGLPEELASRLELSSASALVAVPEAPPTVPELCVPDPLSSRSPPASPEHAASIVAKMKSFVLRMCLPHLRRARPERFWGRMQVE